MQQSLPQAVIVADHCHVVRLANQALTEARQRVTREQTGRRGLGNDPAWARRRLLRGRERLCNKAFVTIGATLVPDLLTSPGADALVDGNNHQIERIKAESAARGVQVPIVVDFVLDSQDMRAVKSNEQAAVKSSEQAATRR